MLRITDTLGNRRVRFHCVQSRSDLAEVRSFIEGNKILGIDTESTRINCYHPAWRMRTTQFGDFTDSYVVPARWRGFIGWAMAQEMYWLGHNGPHDIRCIDTYLGYDTGVVCEGETSIPGRHADSRNQGEGGIGHGLKEQSVAMVSRDAGKWEKALKEAFKEIKVPIPGEVYKSSNSKTGIVKGQPKMRKIRQAEGWELIDLFHPAYVAYAAADPLLTRWLWRLRKPWVLRNPVLYRFDHEIALAVDKLQRRAIKLDVPYTKELSAGYTERAEEAMEYAASFGCENINSSDQIAQVLLSLKVKLHVKTDKGAWSTKASILRKIEKNPRTSKDAKDFINSVLVAKQVLKRREAYAEGMLREMDAEGRVHPSINPLAARTSRMSVTGPALQQLPTRDQEDDLLWMGDDDE